VPCPIADRPACLEVSRLRAAAAADPPITGLLRPDDLAQVSALAGRPLPAPDPRAQRGAAGVSSDLSLSASGADSLLRPDARRSSAGTTTYPTARPRGPGLLQRDQRGLPDVPPPFPARRADEAMGAVALSARLQRTPHRPEEHTSELQSRSDLGCPLLPETEDPSGPAPLPA